MILPNPCTRILLIVALLVPGVARAGWVLDGIPVSTAANNQHLPVVATDGSGGAIIAW